MSPGSRLQKPNLNPDDPITADLSQITMATAGILEPLEGRQDELHAAASSTSTDSEEIPVEKVQGTPDVEGLLHDFKPDGKRLVLAAHVTGPADTAFPDGPPKDAKADAAKAEPRRRRQGAGCGGDSRQGEGRRPLPPQIKTAAQPINVIVVADTDILEDRFWVQVQDFFGQRVEVPVANNGDFVANAVDALAGGNDLISLRSRGTSARPVRARRQHPARRRRAIPGDRQGPRGQAQGHRGQDQGRCATRQGQAGVAAAASETQTLDNFRTEMIQTRQQLRQVQLAEREDINRLKAWLEFFDIAAIPILVGIAALIIGMVRLRAAQAPRPHRVTRKEGSPCAARD